MLKVNGIKSGYGGVTVLQGLDFEVGHEIFAVLGANGAGKTTLMKTVAKVLPLTAGHIEFNGGDVSSTPPYELASQGVSFVPQEQNVFPALTVAENLSLGGLVGRRSKKEALEEVYELFPAIPPLLNQKAGNAERW